MKNDRYGVLILFCFLPLVSFSQNNYFVKDTVTAVGASLVEGNSVSNQTTCKIVKGKTTVEYTPWQVSEYGFDDGRTYVAKNITTPDSARKVFLERLVKGRYNLYYYERETGMTFFLEKDSTLFVELPKRAKNGKKKTFRDDLLHYTSDCPQMADAVKLVRYNRAGYKKLMKRYETCEKRPFPFFRFGITAGYSASKLLPKSSISISEIGLMEYSYDGGFVAGLFIESPVLLSDISVFAELLFTHHEFSANTSINGRDMDFYGKTSSVQVPLLVRYSFPSNKLRPFVNAGCAFLYNFDSEDKLYTATVSPTLVEISGVHETSLIRDAMIGYSVGGGAAFQVRPRNWISLDIRYNCFFSLQSAQAMDISEIQLTTRISF